MYNLQCLSILILIFSANVFLRLVGPPSTWVLSQIFQQASEESIYGRLYKHNMEGLNSFFLPKDALKLVIDKDSVAMFFDDPIYFFKEYHCKVKPNAT